MDWLNSALTDSDSDDSINNTNNNNLNDNNINNNQKIDNQQIDNTVENNNNNLNKIDNLIDKKIDKINNENNNIENLSEEKVELPADDKKSKIEGLFTINKKLREIEKFDNVKIKSQELTETDLLDSKPLETDEKSHNLTDSQPVVIPEPEKYEEGIDYNEAMNSFNKSNINFDKLLKSSQWLGPKVKVTDIKADDLRLSKIEKERNYTCNKEILYEGVKRFNMPTRLMETEDGHVITTNVARRTQKRKHQINWLAMEAQDKEAEIMEQTIHMRKSKRETQMKYGW